MRGEAKRRGGEEEKSKSKEDWTFLFSDLRCPPQACDDAGARVAWTRLEPGLTPVGANKGRPISLVRRYLISTPPLFTISR